MRSECFVPYFVYLFFPGALIVIQFLFSRSNVDYKSGPETVKSFFRVPKIVFAKAIFFPSWFSALTYPSSLQVATVTDRTAKLDLELDNYVQLRALRCSH